MPFLADFFLSSTTYFPVLLNYLNRIKALSFFAQDEEEKLERVRASL